MSEKETLLDILRRWRERGGLRDLLTKTSNTVAIQGSVGVLTGVVGNYVYEKCLGYVAYLFNLLYYYSTSLLVFVSSLILLLVGGVLFWIRGRFPIIYGTVEVFVGVVAATNALARTGLHDLLTAASVIQILGGIYIVVRGLDNIGKGVKGTTLEPRWNKLFAPR